EFLPLSCFYNALVFFVSFFFNDTATTEIYTLSLHDALPISERGIVGQLHREFDRRDQCGCRHVAERPRRHLRHVDHVGDAAARRSEEHTSELQSRGHLVCRLLLEKKKTKNPKSKKKREK